VVEEYVIFFVYIIICCCSWPYIYQFKLAWRVVDFLCRKCHYTTTNKPTNEPPLFWSSTERAVLHYWQWLPIADD